MSSGCAAMIKTRKGVFRVGSSCIKPSVYRLHLRELAQRIGKKIAVLNRVGFGFALKTQTQHWLGVAGTQQAPPPLAANASPVDADDVALPFKDFRHSGDHLCLHLIRAVRAILRRAVQDWHTRI